MLSTSSPWSGPTSRMARRTNRSVSESPAFESQDTGLASKRLALRFFGDTYRPRRRPITAIPPLRSSHRPPNESSAARVDPPLAGLLWCIPPRHVRRRQRPRAHPRAEGKSSHGRPAPLSHSAAIAAKSRRSTRSSAFRSTGETGFGKTPVPSVATKAISAGERA